MKRENLQSTLHADLAGAYRQLTADLWRIGRTLDGNPCFPEDDDQVRTLARQAAARCGAAVAAAVKREKRRLVLQALHAERTNGTDITPAVAQGSARRLLGRGLDSRATAGIFATPGRTAANKSAVSADDLGQLESELHQRLAPLLMAIDHAKNEASQTWFHSRERAEVLADWAEQRRLQLSTLPRR